MKHTIIDASQFELEEKVVSIKRVTKVVKGCLLYTSPSPRDTR